MITDEPARRPQQPLPQRVHPRGKVPGRADGAEARQLAGRHHEREHVLQQLRVVQKGARSGTARAGRCGVLAAVCFVERRGPRGTVELLGAMGCQQPRVDPRREPCLRSCLCQLTVRDEWRAPAVEAARALGALGVVGWHHAQAGQERVEPLQSRFELGVE